MKILMLGTWQRHKAISCKSEAKQIGKFLAERKHILISGGGTGISKLVVESYKKNKGKQFIAYFPSTKIMKKVGEKEGPKPDKTIRTNLDYPGRNMLMVGKCDAVLVLHGGLGTLEEIIHAVKDYHKKVAVIDKGEIAHWIKCIHELKEKVFITLNIKEAIEYLEK